MELNKNKPAGKFLQEFHFARLYILCAFLSKNSCCWKDKIVCSPRQIFNEFFIVQYFIFIWDEYQEISFQPQDYSDGQNI